MYLTQDRDWWRAVVKEEINILVSKNAENFVSSRGPVSLS